MMLKSKARIALLSAFGVVALSTFAWADTTTRADQPLQFVDLHYVSEEAGGIDAVRDYAAWLDGIMRRHGGRVLVVHEVRTVRFGDKVRPQAIFQYEIDSMEALRAVIDDPEYQAGLEHRDALFDFSRAHSFEVRTIYQVPDDITFTERRAAPPASPDQR